MTLAPVRTALVHDFLLDLRGAERVFTELCALFPDADLFTTIYDERGTEGRFAHRNIQTSFLQRLHPSARTFRTLLPLYPYAIESLDLRDYELVVSSSSAWAHGVIVEHDNVHISYCHNPFRYAWNARETAFEGRNVLSCAVLGMIFQRWRQWDWIAAQRVDRYIANSQTTQQRISRYFNRDSAVVHPPVDLTRFTPGPVGGYYLVLSELMPHKRIAVAVQAFNRLGWPLVVAGDGPENRRLARMAHPNVRFAGRVSEQRAAELLAGALALVVTATEEFGIAAVEAQASGRPVIALGDGGLRETVQEGITGAFYDRPDADALVELLSAFDPMSIDPAACVANAARFDVAHFRRGITAVVREALGEARRPQATRHRPRRSHGLAPLRPTAGRRGR